MNQWWVYTLQSQQKRVGSRGNVTPTPVPTKLHAQGFYRGKIKDFVDAPALRVWSTPWGASTP
jgi:hypothetical protein